MAEGDSPNGEDDGSTPRPVGEGVNAKAENEEKDEEHTAVDEEMAKTHDIVEDDGKSASESELAGLCEPPHGTRIDPEHTHCGATSTATRTRTRGTVTASSIL